MSNEKQKHKNIGFFSGPLKFLNSPISQALILVTLLSLMLFTDLTFDNQISSPPHYITVPIGAGLANWFLNRKKNKGFWELFLPWATASAILMACL